MINQAYGVSRILCGGTQFASCHIACLDSCGSMRAYESHTFAASLKLVAAAAVVSNALFRMQLHPYTLRSESPIYLAFNYTADPRAEYDLLFKGQGFDGAFSDNSGTYADYFKENELRGYKWTKLVDYNKRLG